MRSGPNVLRPKCIINNNVIKVSLALKKPETALILNYL